MTFIVFFSTIITTKVINLKNPLPLEVVMVTNHRKRCMCVDIISYSLLERLLPLITCSQLEGCTDIRTVTKTLQINTVLSFFQTLA